MFCPTLPRLVLSEETEFYPEWGAGGDVLE